MSYWTRRQEQLKQTAEKDEAKLKKRLSSFFDAEFKRLEREIAAYYQTYGVDNVIEYRRLLESLPDEDRQLLIERMDEFARKYPQYADLMPVRETIYRLNRLEGLQYSVFMEEANIAGYTSEQMTTYLTGLSQKGVNMAMETLGFGKSFYAINAAVVKQFVDVPWCNGENFSTRIWNDTRKLAQYLNQDIAQGFARGDSYDKLVRQLRKRFSNVNRRDAYRLIFTEGTYVMAESSMQPFTEDFERYRLSPVMDGRTCPICRSLARQVFEIKDRQPGVNFPPIHPWCRCSWEIVVDDWDRWIDDYVAKHSGETKRAETVAKRVDDGIIKSRNISGRNMADGSRKSSYYILNEAEIENVKKDAKLLGIPEDALRFNEGNQTGFSDYHRVINIRGDVLPNMASDNLRDRLSQRAVLAHEYYGHYKNHPSHFRVGDWRDEFRASYCAAIESPGLSDDERRMLMLDAYDRAKEAGVSVRYNKEARRLIYGYDE